VKRFRVFVRRFIHAESLQIQFDTGLQVFIAVCAFYTPKRYKKRVRTTFRNLSFFASVFFILPSELETHDEKGDFLIKIKKRRL
jgi:homogentisate 1,2-dioxygenase